MAMTDAETSAILNILIGIAAADGYLQDADRVELEEAARELRLFNGETIEHLVGREINIIEEARKLKSPEAIRLAYEASLQLASLDKGSSKQSELIVQLERTLQRPQGESEHKSTKMPRLSALYEGVRHALASETLDPIPDETQREEAVHRFIWRQSLVCAALGVFNLPLVDAAAGVLVLRFQSKLCAGIARLHGQTANEAQVEGLISTLSLASRFRLAIARVASLAPIWGSAVGVAANFSTTFALGRAAHLYFGREGKVTMDELRTHFRKSEREAHDTFKKRKPEIEDSSAQVNETLEDLARQLKAGQITRQDYEEALNRLDTGKGFLADKSENLPRVS